LRRGGWRIFIPPGPGGAWNELAKLGPKGLAEVIYLARLGEFELLQLDIPEGLRDWVATYRQALGEQPVTTWLGIEGLVGEIAARYETQLTQSVGQGAGEVCASETSESAPIVASGLNRARRILQLREFGLRLWRNCAAR